MESSDSSKTAENSILEAAALWLRKWEGVVPWLYLDHLGHLTIGVGHLVAKKGADSKKLKAEISKIYHRYGIQQIHSSSEILKSYATSCKAKNQKIVKEWGKEWDTVSEFLPALQTATFLNEDSVPGVWGYSLSKQSNGAGDLESFANEAEQIMKLAAGWKEPGNAFECFNSYRLSPIAISQLLCDDVTVKIGEIKAEKEFQQWDAYPTSAKIVLVDLAFQGGAHGVSQKRLFVTAVNSGRWLIAANEVPFQDIAQRQRSDWRKEQLQGIEGKSLSRVR